MLKNMGMTPSLSDQGALGLIYRNLIKQASMLAFDDVFYFLSIMAALVIPFVLLMKRGEQGPPPMSVH